MSLKERPRACIVGAGSSGIAAAKVLAGRGIDFDCFELGSGIGGNWRYQNDNGMSSAYASLHINTSKTLMQYGDFPMPEGYPDYPDHRQILEYFESYVDHFGFRDRIRFDTEVRDVRPLEGGGFEVTTEPGGTRRYDAVLVANGHHWAARWPDFPGELSDRVEVLHSHEYETPHFLTDKRVVIVGIGNSAVDIACEACRVASRTLLSTRRSAHVFPKYVLGRPTDQLIDPRMARLPQRLQVSMVKALLYLTRGDQERYGVPEPDHSIEQAHPTISDELLHLVGHGRIEIKPNITELAGDAVRFADGSEEPVDAIIYATGYDIRFPFLDPSVLDAEDNEVRLYRRMVHPDIEGLYFIGLVQPLGAIMPIAELQAAWAADLVTGEGALPDRRAMEREIDDYQRELRERYVPSRRHTIQVDFFPYLAELESEIKEGRQRVQSAECRSSSRPLRRFLARLSRNR